MRPQVAHPNCTKQTWADGDVTLPSNLCDRDWKIQPFVSLVKMQLLNGHGVNRLC